MNGTLNLLDALINGLQTDGIFFYKVFWSILFGAAVTAAVDVFVDKEKMPRLLGGSNVRTIGAETTACMLVVFFTALVGSTVLITDLFQIFGLPSVVHAGQLAAFHLRLDYTLILTVLFLALTLALWAVKRQGDAGKLSSQMPSQGGVL